SGCPTVDRCDDANPCPAVEADIFMNADDPKMDVSAPWAWNQVAAYNSVPYVVLTHEVGHFLGLGHENSAPAINGSADNASIESLMDATPRPYAAASVVRADDAAGSAAIYPAGDALCVAEADCVLGDFCADISNNQCPVGSYCPPAGTSCPRAETCMSGACMEHGGDRGSPCIVGGLPGCNSELECVANGENIRGHCTGPCKTDADCTPNGHCRASDEGGEKQCVFGGDLPAGSECDSDDQCQSAACEDQKCAESCEVDCDCSDGYACTSGACVHGRSTCYYRDGRTDNRSLTATLCSVDAPPQPRTRPWAFYVAAIGLGVWFSRRATSRRPPPRR
ncbi:MAG: hypothetical protein KC417_12110, partial [Myxococcales bacterium]|nr:hypothetical protein [Myxococcales bacterium]